MAIFNGTDGNDQDFGVFTGTGANDTFNMYGGDDWMSSSGGNDTFFGGSGSDVVNYEFQGAGVFINNTSAAIGGVSAFSVDKSSGGTDVLDSIEAFHGTSFGDVIYKGDDSGHIFASAGDDEIHLGANGGWVSLGSGDDTLMGHGGWVNLDYGSDHPDTAGAQSNGITVIWSGYGKGTVTDDGWGGTDTFSGVSNIQGSAHNDVFDGSAVTATSTHGMNANGGDGDDTFIGSAGWDFWIGGKGNDTFDGNYTYSAGDDDSVNYFNEGGENGVMVNMLAGYARDTFGDFDTLIGIESVQGTNQIDVFTSGMNFTSFRGFGGGDIFIGSQAVGSWYNRVDYAQDDNETGNGVKVDLAKTGSGLYSSKGWGQATDGWGDTDHIYNIDYIRGSDLRDTILGDNDNNRFRGRDGNDKLKGRGGDDLLQGEDGNDVLLGDAGKDDLQGGDGRDKLYGGKGADRLTGGSDNDVLKGNAGNDVFIFNGTANEGKDTIKDFKDGSDMIEISGVAFAEVTLKKENGGSDTRVILDSGTEILLKNVVKADIDASDFDFV
ncbi:MAG: hypothetical protein KUG74_04055 [Rhodobacteraceae bacterium]|nr:hypothetical protein [Paracoccaceae bacterium]